MRLRPDEIKIGETVRINATGESGIFLSTFTHDSIFVHIDGEIRLYRVNPSGLVDLVDVSDLQIVRIEESERGDNEK